MFKKILCPLDLGNVSEMQLAHARGLAIHQHATISVLHVIPEREVYESRAFRKLSEQYRQIAREELHHLCGPEITPLTDQGNVIDRIKEFAEKRECDLVFMPAAGSEDVRGVWIGSTFQGVLSSCDVSVLTMPPGLFQKRSPEFRPPVRILCALDLTPGSVPLIEMAERLAYEFGSELVLFHCIDIPSKMLHLLSSSELAAWKDEFKNKILDAYRYARDASDIVIESGIADRQITQYATSNSMDLILLGFSKQSEHKIRRVLFRVVSEAEVPVLCTPIG